MVHTTIVDYLTCCKFLLSSKPTPIFINCLFLFYLPFFFILIEAFVNNAITNINSMIMSAYDIGIY